MASREEAKEMVDRNTRQYGYLSDRILGQLDASGRRELEENWEKIESMAGHSVQVLAKHIYGSGARFVFELLQNADDNTYEKAKKKGDPPFISFKFHPDRIVVECNEDGFNERDLGAICSVGKSTKAGSSGYIGAKGIGFKSVFIAAWKVYIQSGHLSFYFRHEKGDSGLGMIRPIWKEPEEELARPLTRMTLYIHQRGDAEDLQHLRKIITDQFKDLQSTCLLFLKKIKNISVSFYNEDGSLEDTKSFKAVEAGTNRVSLETLSGIGSQGMKQTRSYHVTTHLATNIAKSHNRDNLATEKDRQMACTAEVILAFPLTATSEPLLGKQEIFAFLPMRESEYKFIIQSDFDTDANRQDISTTSKRNLDLLDGIASAFVKAVLQFFDDPNLCYQWPRFLPTLENSFTGFWSRLNEKIKDKIWATPIIRSRYRMNPRLISDVYQLGSDITDEHGDCLYDDTSDDPYISKKYEWRDVKILMSYGLKMGSITRCLGLLGHDLDMPDSRMKDFSRSHLWHSSAAISLTEWATTCTAQYIKETIRSLSLIPLGDGRWVSANSGPVYSPTTKNILIPLDLGLRVLDPRSLANLDRKRLFERLGVAEASADLVRTSIESYYNNPRNHLNVGESVSHLTYLYLSHDSSTTRSKIRKLRVFTNRSTKNPNHENIYIANGDLYGPKLLLEATLTAPGYEANYLNPSYLENVPMNKSSQLSWEDWFYDFVGIERRLPITLFPKEQLSPQFKYVAQHRPDKFIDALEYLWKHQSFLVKGNSKIKEQIRALFASEHCEAGPDSIPGPLSCRAWLPFSSLKKHVARYTKNMIFFPFLRIDNLEDEGMKEKWAFLHNDFGIGRDEDISFYLQILQSISNLKIEGELAQAVFDLYETLEARITISDDRREASTKIETFLLEQGLILSPRYKYESAKWLGKHQKVRWGGPPDLQFMHTLEQRYREVLKDNQMQKLTIFFRNTLGIRDTSWHDIVYELRRIKEENEEDGEESVDFDRIQGLYKFMAGLKAPKADVKEAFEQNPLIYVLRKGIAGWYKSSDCLWSSTSEIRGRVTLNDDYDDLKSFFTQSLGVKSLTLQMIYDELRHSKGQKPIDDVKTDIWSLNALLQTDKTHLDPSLLLRENIIPVKYPGESRALRNIETVFAVGDSRQLSTRLENHIKLLDYDFEEIRRLKPFIHWSKLDERYLSQSVREFTRVPSTATTRPITQEKYNISRKAYAILRIAKTFQSPKYDEDDPQFLYDVIREAEVIETDSISSVVSISQDGKTIDLEESAGMEHIDYSEDKLKVYVPLNRNKRELCFSSSLPTKLTDWLMREWDSNIPNRSEKDAIHILSTVLSCDLAVVDQILELNSVFEADVPNQDPRYDEESEDNDHRPDEEVSETSQIQFTPSMSSRSEASDLYRASPIGGGTLSPEAHSRGYSEPRFASDDGTLYVVESVEAVAHQSRRTPRASVWNADEPTPRRASDAQDTGYLRLLNHVIAASRNAAFPSHGTFDMTGLLNGLPNLANRYESFDGLDVAPRFRSANQLERDKMVGAAGELYVFEFLSTLRLSAWSRANWQSTIRKYVTEHPAYNDMEPWCQRETADIVYQDVESEFTALLIENGYLREEWRAARPKYLIEVKTSTGPLATPFYMSKNQYRLMQDIHGVEDRSQIYMILRVFWLDSDKIGMRMYLNPEQMRQDGGLVFTGETWSIIPGNGSGNR